MINRIRGWVGLYIYYDQNLPKWCVTTHTNITNMLMIDKENVNSIEVTKSNFKLDKDIIDTSQLIHPF